MEYDLSLINNSFLSLDLDLKHNCKIQSLSAHSVVNRMHIQSLIYSFSQYIWTPIMCQASFQASDENTQFGIVHRAICNRNSKHGIVNNQKQPKRLFINKPWYGSTMEAVCSPHSPLLGSKLFLEGGAHQSTLMSLWQVWVLF